MVNVDSLEHSFLSEFKIIYRQASLMKKYNNFIINIMINN
jgi:hypothetical protein